MSYETLNAVRQPASPQVVTQTYATAQYTVDAATASAVSTASAALTLYGFSQAQADSIPVALNALIVDVLALRKTVNGIVDQLQAVGIMA